MPFSRRSSCPGVKPPSPGDLPAQGLNLSLPHCRHIFLPYEPPGKPNNIRACSHSLLQGIFPTQDWTWVSCIAGRFFIIWAPGKLKVKVLVTRSCPTLCDPMDYSPPTFLFMGLSQQEHWSGLPFPSLGYLPDQGIKLLSPTLAGGFFSHWATWE